MVLERGMQERHGGDDFGIALGSGMGAFGHIYCKHLAWCYDGGGQAKIGAMELRCW
jgi:hypothetical protein